MRVAVGPALRVGPGDEVVIRGELARSSKLSRLFLFAKEGNADYSPYVANVREKLAVGGEPHIMKPMSMRLDVYRQEAEIVLTSDIDGYLRLMQEVDNAKEVRAKVRLKRRICPDLPVMTRIIRKLSGISAWNN